MHKASLVTTDKYVQRVLNMCAELVIKYIARRKTRRDKQRTGGLKCLHTNVDCLPNKRHELIITDYDPDIVV